MRGLAYIMGSALTMASVVSSTSILLPLYQWPTDNTTWSAVYDAAAAHPAIHFQIIVNPDSGPGDTTYPESSYIDGVSQLNSYSNVEVIGYVHTEYATRDISVIESEISTYSGWSSYKELNITLSGIFFDEAPSSNDSTLVSYMQQVSTTAKSNNLNTVVFNPGTKVEDEAYFDAADLIVEFENSYSTWLSSIPANDFTNTAGYSKGAVILYSAPLTSDYETILQEVDQMGLGAAYLTNTDDYTNANSVTKVAAALKSALTETSSSLSSSSALSPGHIGQEIE
ncbi:Spherulation-specific family 4 [Penicillium angulare]|uniref:Spherulation-specific family 4 n=1 Tax=Penicillium angulare TaxID=116970 RepID=A0A9W9EJS5_9EURO|nr:Spherulation-specific family 4 [Penicillium angulare]